MNNKIVYSTDPDYKQRCPNCGEALNACTCQEKTVSPPAQQTAHIRREIKGRKGKTVTTVGNLQGDLKSLQKKLQQQCGTGGSLKGSTMEIQGDHRKKIAEILENLGYKTKFIGG